MVSDFIETSQNEQAQKEIPSQSMDKIVQFDWRLTFIEALSSE